MTDVVTKYDSMGVMKRPRDLVPAAVLMRLLKTEILSPQKNEKLDGPLTVVGRATFEAGMAFETPHFEPEKNGRDCLRRINRDKGENGPTKLAEWAISESSSTIFSDIFGSKYIADISRNIGNLTWMVVLEYCTEEDLEGFKESEVDHRKCRSIDKIIAVDSANGEPCETLERERELRATRGRRHRIRRKRLLVSILGW